MLNIELHCSSASDTGYLLQIEILKIKIHNRAVNPSNAVLLYVVSAGQCDGRTCGVQELAPIVFGKARWKAVVIFLHKTEDTPLLFSKHFTFRYIIVSI